MAKECNKDDCTNPIFGKGFCKWHQFLREDKKKPKKKVFTIKPISDKMAAKYKEYRSVRDIHMAENPICEFKGCTKVSQDLHHKAGRGKFMCDKNTFMAICRKHHTWIHEHPKESRELGYLI